jgi:hypothetical protein
MKREKEKNLLATKSVLLSGISLTWIITYVASNHTECNLYFVASSLEWIQNTQSIDANEGKLQCPKCDAKVGSWKWAGGQVINDSILPY